MTFVNFSGQNFIRKHQNSETSDILLSFLKQMTLFNLVTYFLSLILAWTVTKRHWLLEESIGTMTIENEAFKTIWITFSVALISFIVRPILSCSLFKRINSSYHLCHDQRYTYRGFSVTRFDYTRA